MANEKKIRVGITHGDTNGIGLEVILKTLANPQMVELCTPVLYSSSRIMTYHRKAIEMPAVPFTSVRSAQDVRDGVNNIVEIFPDEVKVEIGTPSEIGGRAAFISLEHAVADLKAGLIDVLVTAPINKSTIQSEEFQFPGHTEYLEAALGDGRSKALMILFNESIKIALVTTHLPVSKIAQAITKESVLEKLTIFNNSLRRDFFIECPRIAVLALNPHAGDGGLLGTEERDIITPAIKQANDKKIVCFGPYPADGFFGSQQYKHFDGVLAMYHDQGLAPLKTLSMASGVNFTAGLPFVRTSPDHGTGFDIAGKNIADESSFREAIYQAIDIFRNRRRFDEAAQNPLRKQYFDRSNDNVVLDLTKDDDDDPAAN
ncbi:MAG: 4-hydroxythreonine-4-phosphate dehydrogenase PdxA [Muribaculaceae bacterium]|jgi:4-hydroxythreonine-4-phosphate dehydrogenase|nr:4-hydroxythreonine-4-phosphate dehydrogenase PdxA [Muribaculaceae bacterium]